jgi:hypothetical protein
MQASVGLIIDDAYVRVAFSRDVPGSAEGGPTLPTSLHAARHHPITQHGGSSRSPHFPIEEYFYQYFYIRVEKAVDWWPAPSSTPAGWCVLCVVCVCVCVCVVSRRSRPRAQSPAQHRACTACCFRFLSLVHRTTLM